LEDAPVRILVIDDDRAVLFTIAAPLKAEGFEVVTAHSGAEGLQTFQQSPFDIVIVDIFMPGMDGVKVIKKFRHHCRRIPIIALSEEASLIGGLVARDAPFYDANISPQAVDGLNKFAGANGLISQPVPYDRLVAPPFIRQRWNE
jgi:CheY-like chemotaxis protein